MQYEYSTNIHQLATSGWPRFSHGIAKEMNSRNLKNFQKPMSLNAIAVAVCGMKNKGEVDKAALNFTIHLTSGSRETRDTVTRLIFDHIETYYKKRMGKPKAQSHCGVVSIPDCDGSKFSGALADEKDNANHIHGVAFLPRNSSEDNINELISILEIELLHCDHVRANCNSIQVVKAEAIKDNKDLSGFIAYAMKQVAREERSDICSAMPFDHPDYSIHRPIFDREIDRVTKVLNGTQAYTIISGIGKEDGYRGGSVADG